MKKFSKVLLTALATLSLFAQSANAEDYEIRAFYGDKANQRVVVIDIDVDNMEFTDSVYTVGEDPYPVDQAGTLDKVYAITRGSNSIDVIDASTLAPMGLIKLKHHPRSSEAYNAVLGLQLVTGADKPMASLIDVETDKVVGVVGDDSIPEEPIGDYGGSNATGHPFWFTDDKFALIDRVTRKIEMYQVTQRKGKGAGWRVTLIDSVTTPTAVHHFVNRDTSTLSGKESISYYALTEGSPDAGIAPSILKYTLQRNQLNLVGEASLVEEDNDIIADMGSHHADVHPDGEHMYVGSTEGNTYVIDMKKMEVIKTVEAGAGAGHTTFVPKWNLAIVTNHKDTFVTIIDTTTHTKIDDVNVSEGKYDGVILQSHSSFVHPNMDFFYAFATADGIFYELDLRTLEVSREVETGGTPLQGVFMCKDEDGVACGENLM
jgi:DNA-binding beta-propeller fold protein YncE